MSSNPTQPPGTHGRAVDTSSPKDKNVEITVGLGPDGKIYNPSFRSRSNIPQFDAECLEAVLGLSPFTKPTTLRGPYLIPRDGVFDENSVPSFRGEEVNNYARNLPQELVTHPGPKNFVIVNKIPLQILERFPGMFKEEELVSIKNLVAIRCVEENFQKPW